MRPRGRTDELTRHSELHHEYRRRASRVAAIVSAISEIQGLLIDAHNAAQHVLAAPSSGLSERVSGGNTSAPTESAFMARLWVQDGFDEIDEILDRLLTRPGAPERNGELDRLQQRLTQLKQAGIERDRADVEPRSNMVDCLACERLILGTSDDPVRKGYCNACDVAWRRLQREWTGPGAPDRAMFERSRRGADRDPSVRVLVDPARSVVSSVNVDGVDVAITSAESAELLIDGVPSPERVRVLVDRIRSGQR